MNVKVYPSKMSGTVYPPSSKSVAHRMIIGAALSNGKSRINNISFSKDIEATVSAVQAFGADVKKCGDSLEIIGAGKSPKAPVKDVFCGESGSTLRFLIPIFSLTGQKVNFTGEGRLLSRPQDVYADIFKAQGILFLQDEKCLSVDGALKSGVFTVRGDVSSQFITGLIFALPLLSGDSEIRIIPPFESKSYVDITMDVLKRFGVHAYFEDELTIKIEGGQSYRPIEAKAEGDFSQMAFFAVPAAICGNIKIGGMNESSLQGDRVIADILKNAGSDIHFDGGFYKASAKKLCFGEIDIADCPDLGPILTVILALSGGGKIINAKRLRIKESDRIASMEENLKKAGVMISSDEDSITVGKYTPSSREICVSSFNDHRVVMSMAVFAALSNAPLIIENAEAVSKSYPSFFEDLEMLHVKVEYLC